MKMMRIVTMVFRLVIAAAIGVTTVANASTFMMHEAMSSKQPSPCTVHHHASSQHMMDMTDCVSVENLKHSNVSSHPSGCLDCQTLHCQNINFISALTHDFKLSIPDTSQDTIIQTYDQTQIHSGYWTRIIRPPKS
ncbi:hypothetical protein I2F17_09320 [Acinetobacter sp. B10A]|uniref:hypothetical protein n=1 Tax=Acinetobacter baretiae TaxID=2605383 RepID=UPI001B3C8911|nr:hypothetical protein [Acinetobacter baretiae]MBF7686016.1 hypothetical protein [Acinetobacter baretiae]